MPKIFTTQTTRIRFFTSMNPHMNRQTTKLTKSRIAKSTCKGGRKYKMLLRKKEEMYMD